MKLPKFPVFGRVLCGGAISYYIISSLKPEDHKKEMVIRKCADECKTRAQKLTLVCPKSSENKQGRFIVTGNWKMNGDKRTADHILKVLRCGSVKEGNQVILGIPAPYIDYVQQNKPKFVEVAAQNIYKEPKGAFPGEISADMVNDVGAKYVILGAAERKTVFHEDYEFIGEKANLALQKGLNVILCVGETDAERENNEHIAAIHNQLSTVLRFVPKQKWENMIIVYEPLWTHSTDRTSTPEEAKEVALAIRQWFSENLDKETSMRMRIQYGGPLSAATAKSMAMSSGFDGLYVGAASLRPDFLSYVNANERPKKN